jgi:hypothetical protein
MSDRLRTYRERAAECMKLSKIGCDTAIREGFCKLAESYLKLANAAEQKAGAQTLKPS